MHASYIAMCQMLVSVDLKWFSMRGEVTLHEPFAPTWKYPNAHTPFHPESCAIVRDQDYFVEFPDHAAQPKQAKP